MIDVQVFNNALREVDVAIVEKLVEDAQISPNQRYR